MLKNEFSGAKVKAEDCYAYHRKQYCDAMEQLDVVRNIESRPVLEANVDRMLKSNYEHAGSGRIMEIPGSDEKNSIDVEVYERHIRVRGVARKNKDVLCRLNHFFENLNVGAIEQLYKND